MNANTTVMVIEIISNGFLAFVWIGIIIFKIFKVNLSLQFINENISTIDALLPFAIIVVSIFAYQIGWLVDHISYWIFYYLGPPTKIKDDKDNIKKVYWYGIGRRIKNNFIEDNEFLNTYMKTYKNCNEIFRNELEVDLNLVRFSRSAILNFSLIGIFIWLIPNIPYKIQMDFILAIIILFCIATLVHRWKNLFLKMSRY